MNQTKRERESRMDREWTGFKTLRHANTLRHIETGTRTVCVYIAIENAFAYVMNEHEQST